MAKSWAKIFYHSRAWQAVREQALIRDGYTCSICGARATEVHHVVELTPDNIADSLVALNPSNLRSLCHDCHTRITDRTHSDAFDCDNDYYFNSDGQLSPRRE